MRSWCYSSMMGTAGSADAIFAEDNRIRNGEVRSDATPCGAAGGQTRTSGRTVLLAVPSVIFGVAGLGVPVRGTKTLE